MTDADLDHHAMESGPTWQPCLNHDRTLFVPLGVRFRLLSVYLHALIRLALGHIELREVGVVIEHQMVVLDDRWWLRSCDFH